MQNIEHVKKKINLHFGNLEKNEFVNSLISKIKPEKIFHLAAQSNIMKSFEEPIKTIQTNFFGTLNLLEAIRKTSIDPVIMLSSSSDVYGIVNKKEIPIKETVQANPISPYGVSKSTVELLMIQYFQTYGLKSFGIRAFPHTGPRRSALFAESSFAKQIVEIKKNQRKFVNVGNLEIVRTYTDVRDMVEAYWVGIKKCKFGQIYNVGNEKPIELSEVLEKLIKLSKSEIKIKKKEQLLRVKDTNNHIPNINKFKKQTNWKPKIPLEKTLNDLLDYWGKMLSNKKY